MAKNGITPRELGLKSDSFSTDIPDKPVQRAIMNVEALQKQGKDHFSMESTPDPIVIFNFDQGLDGVIQKFKRKKTIIVAGMPKSGGKSGYPHYHFARPVPETRDMKADIRSIRRSTGYLERVKAAAGPIWERFIHDFYEALHSDARTLVVDTGGGAFALGKFAFHGMDKVTSKDDPYGQKSGDLNSIFQGLFADSYSYDKNVLWLHRLKDKFDAPGQYDIVGYKQAPFETQITVRLSMKKGKPRAEIRDCRMGQGSKWNGEIFEDGEANFLSIVSNVWECEPEEFLE